jgi:hypothetical protein
MSGRRYVAGLLVLLVVVLALGVGGCEKAAEKAVEGVVEKTTGVDMDTSDGSVTYETEDGGTVEISGDQAEIPADFPDDFPVYDADIESSTRLASGEGTAFYVGLATKDSYDEVFAWYKDRLVSEGWDILAEVNTQDGGTKSGVMTVAKGSAEGGATFAQDGDVTRIAISLNVK